MLDATPLNVHLHLDNLAHRLDAALEDVYWFTGLAGFGWYSTQDWSLKREETTSFWDQIV